LSSSSCGNGPVALTTPSNVAPGAPGAVVPAWDGLNEQPVADADATVDITPPKKQPRRRDAPPSQLSARARTDLSWQDQQVLDQAEEARLSRKLIICKNCSSTQ
jgi:hypothetical protein